MTGPPSTTRRLAPHERTSRHVHGPLTGIDAREPLVLVCQSGGCGMTPPLAGMPWNQVTS